MKQIIIAVGLLIGHFGYGQDCTNDVHAPCSWAFNTCHYKEKVSEYKEKKVVDVERLVFVEDCAKCCAKDFQLDTIAPNFVQDLPNIEVLKMPLVCQFPSGISALKSLKKVEQYAYHSLYSHKLFYQELPQIPAELWGMQSLEELSLYVEQLPAAIQQLSQLRFLELHIENHLKGNVLPEAAIWQKLDELETVRLRSEYLKQADLNNLSGLKKLRSFSLQTNNEQDYFAYACLDVLKDNYQTIEELVLMTNTYRYDLLYDSDWARKETKKIRANDDAVTKVVANPLETTACPNLKRLVLRDCAIAVFELNTNLLPKLERLDLSFNKLKDLKINANTASSIKELDLAHNYLTSLPSDITKLTNLEVLDLSGNPILSLPKGIEELPNLKKLILDARTPEAIQKELKARLGARLILSNDYSYPRENWLNDNFLALSKMFGVVCSVIKLVAR